MARIVTVNDVLDGHVVLDIECLDRDLPERVRADLAVQRAGGRVHDPAPGQADPVARADRAHRDAVPQGGGVLRRLERGPVGEVRQGRPEDRRHAAAPGAQAATGKSGVAAVGVSQEFQRVWSACQRDTQTAVPQYTFVKADRRVTCYCFYVWDENFGPAFIKVCAYFPCPAKIWVNGQYAERPAMPHRVGAGLVGEPIAPGFAA
jgi:hypothetical protein